MKNLQNCGDCAANFDNAPQKLAGWIVNTLGPDVSGRIIRDIYGRLSFVTTEAAANQLAAHADQTMPDLDTYIVSRAHAIAGVPQDELSEFLSEPSLAIPGHDLRLIDRRVFGDEWLTRSAELAESPQRLVFHSMKGGVGRSTGLIVTAAHLASRGLNVLIIDLDLEAPGIGPTLLSSDEMPDYGVVDWFAATAAGADSDEMVAGMATTCGLTSARAVVDVVPACGRFPLAHISKLARAYTPGATKKEFSGHSFAQKTDTLIRELCERRAYDVVLIDTRSGLHETSGSAILSLGAKVLLFGTDSDQSFYGIAILFDTLRESLTQEFGGEDVRGAFKMVHAKAPGEARDRQKFNEHSWALWTSFLYDNNDHLEAAKRTAFTFDLEDKDAPHFPLEIIDNGTHFRINPSNVHQLDAETYGPIFGSFLKGIEEFLGLT